METEMRKKHRLSAPRLRAVLNAEHLCGLPGLSGKSRRELIDLQPATALQALHVRGVGRKTAARLLALGLVRDPEGVLNRARTLEEHAGSTGVDGLPGTPHRKQVPPPGTKRGSGIRAGRLDELIAEATVDCYGESEELTGIFTLLEENLATPFSTNMLGVEVTVERLELTDDGTITALCRRLSLRQRVPILDLPLPEPAPGGAEWIDAYRRWARRR